MKKRLKKYILRFLLLLGLLLFLWCFLFFGGYLSYNWAYFCYQENPRRIVMTGRAPAAWITRIKIEAVGDTLNFFVRRKPYPGIGEWGGANGGSIYDWKFAVPDSFRYLKCGKEVFVVDDLQKYDPAIGWPPGGVAEFYLSEFPCVIY